MTIPEIVTLAQVQAHLRLDPVLSGSPPTPEEDPDLQLKIDAATEVICRRIATRKPDDPAWVATIESWTASGSPSVLAPSIVRLAVMEQVAELYRFRGDDVPADRPTNDGDLCDSVKSLLKAGGYLTEAWA
jgi:hypothetical protein